MGGPTKGRRMEPGNGAVASERARDELSDRRRGADREREPQVESPDAHLKREDRANLLRFMAMMRASEERGITLYRQGKIPGSFYDGCGQEAISVGSSYVLGPRDRMCILHRDLGAHFVRGLTPDRYLANYMGRSGGVTGGKDGNVHFGARELGCVGMVSMLPDMALVANGMAHAFKLRGERRVAMTYFGEGSTANGQWHEAMNYAAVFGLPVVFILENNGFAYSTPNELEFAVDPVERARTYGFPGVLVDGNDVEAVFEAARAAAERARAGEGPTLIECRTMRMHGHGAHDDMRYVPKEMFEKWSKRDPIERYGEKLVAELRLLRRRGRGDQVGGEGLRRRVREAGARLADARSRDGDRRRLRRGADATRRRQGALVVLGRARAARSERRLMAEMTYLEAISDGLREEMRRDETVLCLGEDIGTFGGAFKITDGFVEEFGGDRVIDTPLAENAIIGAAVGAAVEGMKPVCEMQFADFIACGFDQLVNVAGRMHYRQGLAVPIVVRLPSGGGFSGGPFHSQNPEAWFMQSPGLKVVAPATAADAKGLLTAAIRDPNPVCYLEHKGLYRYIKGEVPEGDHTVELGKARVAREGEEMTVIAYGSAVHLALEAAAELDQDIEVIDLRSLCPLDTDAILASARKTGKVLVAHEATQSCGVAAEVAALVAAEAFEDLDAPVRRLTAADVPIPFSPPLEQAVLPQLEDMKEACDELLAY